MNKLWITLCLTLLGACASKPPPPDWQGNAFAALNSYSSAYLDGNTRVADLEFSRAKTEVSRTGRPDLMARIELVRCATQVASLVFEPCRGYLAVSADAKPPEQAYAAFISGQWTGLDAKLLPEVYQGLVTQAMENSKRGIGAPTGQVADPVANSAAMSTQLNQIQDPLSRLVAASALLQKELISTPDIGLAVEMASSQGWRRPLLAWLTVQQQQARAKGDTSAATGLQRRIDLVLQAPAH